MLFGISTYITSVKPGNNQELNDPALCIYTVYIIAINVVSESTNVDAITTSLKNIAAAHFIIVLAITGKQPIANTQTIILIFFSRYHWVTSGTLLCHETIFQ